ncbi:Aa_trans domain-containing protein [Durusdinium trenchii]|uniref:Aa_trans domain-containing protein n=1 Tax=Durusdinium trenchii TaxID=1381693 RepID=A0ABP0IIX5_9DINO
MFAICAVEMSCAFIHGMFALSDAPPDYHSVGPNIPGGLFDMVLAFGGIAILPYVLADMLQPENSRKVVIKATTQIMFFYLSVAMICYFGWADSIQHETPLRLMMSMSTGYQYAARIISFLFIIKTVTTFPLTFWPLYREVEALLDLHEVPGLQLQLPWAIRRQRFLKAA